MQLNRDFRERQGEGWERPDAMDQRFNPIDTCPRCDEPTERELAVINGEKLCDACIDDRLSAELKTASKRGPGETIATVVSRANGILRKYGLERGSALVFSLSEADGTLRRYTRRASLCDLRLTLNPLPVQVRAGSTTPVC